MMGWVSLHRSEETMVLMKEYPQAFLLLCQIALRAKRKDCRITKLKARQARIGDWREAGITSEKAYRTAKGILESSGLVTFQASNQGTLATLADSSVFTLAQAEREATSAENVAPPVTPPQAIPQPSQGGHEGTPAADGGRPENEPVATNKNERRKRKESISLPQTGESERASDDPIPWERKIYEAYPRKVGKAAGLIAILRALRSRPPEFLLERTQRFAKAISWQEPRFIPHPATWFSQERFDDDPAEWEDPESRPAAGVGDGNADDCSPKTVTIGGRTYTMP